MPEEKDAEEEEKKSNWIIKLCNFINLDHWIILINTDK